MSQHLTDDQAQECIGWLLDDATDLNTRLLSDRADLTPAAAFAINRVSREGPIRLTALAAKEGVSQPSMTQLMQRLERAELVARIPDPDDGRACLLAITEQGQTLLNERRRIRRRRLGELLTSLSTEEQNALWLSARVAAPILARLTGDQNPAAPADDTPG